MANILLSCCNDDEAMLTIAEGNIYHSGTKKPLEGVKIYIYDGLPDSNRGSNKRDSTVTDSSGFFHVEFEAEEPVLFPYKENYSFEYTIAGAVIGIVPLKVGENKNLRFELDAYANFNPILKGTMSLENDKILFDILTSNGIKEGWLRTCFGNGPHKFSILGYPTKSDTYKTYWLKYQIQGEWHEKIDSAFIELFTTYTDTIYY
jgi:hypothetical protein